MQFFSPEPGGSNLVGIARLASQSPLLDAKARVEYLEIPTRRYLTHCDSARVPFERTINSYRGCEYGCKYCYARYAHEFMELRNPELFETKIFVKQWNRASFKEELRGVPHDTSIGIGTATDPYQPAERRYKITRQMLEVIAESAGGYHFWITTKSALITRDLDLLQEMQRKNFVYVSVTITTTNERLARIVEPYAPSPATRLNAVRKLVAAGIETGVGATPVLPDLTDTPKSLDRLAYAVAATGAKHFGGHVLFLKPCAQSTFYEFLEKKYPHLVRRYRDKFGASAYLKGGYPELIQERINEVRARHGLQGRCEGKRPDGWPETAQLTLFS